MSVLIVSPYVRPNPDLAHPCEPETLGALCPECDCHGSIVIYHSMVRSWETGEYDDTEEIVCEACDGLGFLTTPADPDPDMQEAHEKARRFTITRR